jgi:hypothetical protein
MSKTIAAPASMLERIKAHVKGEKRDFRRLLSMGESQYYRGALEFADSVLEYLELEHDD